MGLGLHNSSVFTPNSPVRFGIEIGFQKLTVELPSFPANNTSFSAFRVQGSVDRRVIGDSALNLSVGLAGGFSFIKDSGHCNELFCNLPKSGLLVTPSVEVAMRVSPKVAVFFDTRWTAYLNDGGSTYPYKNGVVFAVGVSFQKKSDSLKVKNFGGSGEGRGLDF